MSTSVTFNGTSYTIPAIADSTWGTAVANYLIAISTGCLQKTGGAFTLTAEANFGATYGIKACYLKSYTTNPASAGAVRLAKSDLIYWRNNANGADVGLGISASDFIQWAGVDLVDKTTAQTLTNKTLTAPTLTTPALGVATATSINKVALTAPATGATLTLADGSTLATSGAHAVTLTLSADTNVTLPTSGTLVARDSTDALTNKDFQGGTASNTSRLTVPSASNATLQALTRKVGTLVYDTGANQLLSDDGTNLNAIGAGQGDRNYCTAPSVYTASSALGWNISVSGNGAATNITASLPRLITDKQAIQFVSSSSGGSGDYLRYRFQLDDADLSKKLRWVFSQIVAASGDYKIQVFSGTDSSLSSAAQLTLSTDDTTPQTLLSAFTGDFPTTFDTSTRSFYEVRFVATGNSKTLKVSSNTVGPQKVTPIPAVGPLGSLTLTLSAGFGTTTNVAFQGWREVNLLQVKGRFTAGTTAASVATIAMPSGSTISSSVLSSNASGFVVGKWTRTKASTAANLTDVGGPYEGVIFYDGSDTANLYMGYQVGSDALVKNNGNNVTSSSCHVLVEFEVPVAEWAGAANYAGSNDVEYASNSSTADANDTTSFAYGPSGSQFPAPTTERSRKVQFLTPIQATDDILLQVSTDSGVTWLPVGQGAQSPVTNMQVQNTLAYGMGWSPNDATSILIYIEKYRLVAAGVGYGTAGTDWSAITASPTYKWRARKAKSGMASGFGIVRPGVAAGLVSASGLPGRTDGNAPGAGMVGEKITGSAITSPTALTTSFADISSITLTAGNWELRYEVSLNLQCDVSVGNLTYLNVEITDSGGSSLIGASNRIFNAGQTDVSTKARSMQGTATATELLYISASTTYKLRAKKVDSSGTGSGSVYNETGANGSSVFFAVRLP